MGVATLILDGALICGSTVRRLDAPRRRPDSARFRLEDLE
jgi:hypothetical protein